MNSTKGKKKYEICSVPKYNTHVYKITENIDKIDIKTHKNKSIVYIAEKFIDTISNIKKELKIDKQYHEYIFKDDKLKLCIDIDKLTKNNSNATFEQVIKDICEYINITENDISYTTNKSITTGSYHIVISKYWMLSSTQKIFWINFQKIYKYGDEVDYGIYGCKGKWFRLPNQTKESIKNTEHIIIKGKIEDFVLKYIGKATEYIYELPITEIKIKDKILKKITVITNNSTLELDKYKYLILLNDIIGNKRNSNGKNIIGWECWFLIATILKTNSFNKQNFLDYSSKYEDNTDKASKLWDSITTSSIYSIYTLQNIAKVYNPNDYKIWLNKYFNNFKHISNEFEKIHCKIINKKLYIKEFENNNIFFSHSEIKTTYSHLVYNKINPITGVKEEASFINAWINNNPTIRYYDDMDIFPPDINCKSNYYNLWKSFAMELITNYIHMEEELQFILNHIKILCNNEDEVYNYYIKWIGQMIQYPSVKSICPTFISNQGAGKGTLIKLYELMLGKSKVFETQCPSRDVWGNFNGQMSNCFLVFLDEIDKKDTTESLGKIKGLITEPTLTINNKGVNQITINSFHRFHITTNNPDPIKTSRDDRRNLIIQSSDELIGNKEYFYKIYDMLNDTNVIKTCYEYFKQIPNLNKFNKIAIPHTEYQDTLKENSIPIVEKFLRDFTIDNIKEEEIIKYGCEIHDIFMEWCSKKKILYNCKADALGFQITNLKIDGISKGKRTNKGITKIYNIKKLILYFKLNDNEDNEQDNNIIRNCINEIIDKYN